MLPSTSPQLSGPYVYFSMMAPLWELDHYKSKYSRNGLTEEDIKDISFIHLVIETLEYVIQATQQDGALLHDIRAHLVQKLDRMCKDLPALKAQAIADIVIGKLNNGDGAMFETRYYVPQENQHLPLQYRFMAFEPDAMNINRFRLTSEGYAIYYMLNKTIAVDDPNLESAVMDVMLEKGTASHVLTAARQAKAMAFELYQRIQSTLNRAYRSPEKVHWAKDVKPLLDEAEKAIRLQQEQHARHNNAALARLAMSEEEQSSSARIWEHVVEIMNGTSLLRQDLMSNLRNASSQFNQAKLRCLSIRPRSALASLSTDLLPQLFQAPQEDLLVLADQWFPMLMPPQRWPRWDLATLETIALLDIPQEQAVPVHRAPVLVDPPVESQYSSELRDSVHAWIADYTATRKEFSFSDSMLQYCQTPRSYEEQYFFAWTLFNKYNNPVFNNTEWTSMKDGQVWEHDYLCADDVKFFNTLSA